MADGDDIRDSVSDDVNTGIQSVTADGVQVTAMDPAKRLDVADRLDGNTAASVPTFGLRMTKLRSPGAN
jgi:hypothetical protein